LTGRISRVFLVGDRSTSPEVSLAPESDVFRLGCLPVLLDLVGVTISLSSESSSRGVVVSSFPASTMLLRDWSLLDRLAEPFVDGGGWAIRLLLVRLGEKYGDVSLGGVITVSFREVDVGVEVEAVRRCGLDSGRISSSESSSLLMTIWYGAAALAGRVGKISSSSSSGVSIFLPLVGFEGVVIDFEGVIIDFEGVVVDFEGVVADFKGVVLGFVGVVSSLSTEGRLESESEEAWTSKSEAETIIEVSIEVLLAI